MMKSWEANNAFPHDCYIHGIALYLLIEQVHLVIPLLQRGESTIDVVTALSRALRFPVRASICLTACSDHGRATPDSVMEGVKDSQASRYVFWGGALQQGTKNLLSYWQLVSAKDEPFGNVKAFLEFVTFFLRNLIFAKILPSSNLVVVLNALGEYGQFWGIL